MGVETSKARLKRVTPVIHEGCTNTDVTFGAYVEIGAGRRVGGTVFGDYSYCDQYADIMNAVIGKFANIAAFSRIGAVDHLLETASYHRFLYRSGNCLDDAEPDAEFFAQRHERRSHIGHDCWIGSGAMVKPEVRIGDGAVVATGAVVTRDVEPYVIVAGTPAKPLRRRPPVEIADRLIALAWWEWSHDTLRAALLDFRTLPAEAFLEKYESA